MDPFTYDFLIFIGRFQPFHNGHLAVIQAALAQSKHVIILCGSAYQPRSLRNPWSVEEREAMVRSSLSPAANQRIYIAPLMDNTYNDQAWVDAVQATVKGGVNSYYEHAQRPQQAPKIGLIGHSKDQSSYYLTLFPQWAAVDVSNYEGISATPIRQEILAAASDRQALASNDGLKAALPLPVYEGIKDFAQTEVFRQLQSEQAYVDQYQQAWQSAPYPPIFVTVDAVVVHAGRLLLIERKRPPGQGLLALPGGFLDQQETLLAACLRELREETGFDLSESTLKKALKTQQVFDHPYRSARGRTLTHAFYFHLDPHSDLPAVTGSDDALRALWLPLAELDPSRLFEDHYFIIQAIMEEGYTTSQGIY